MHASPDQWKVQKEALKVVHLNIPLRRVDPCCNSLLLPDRSSTAPFDVFHDRFRLNAYLASSERMRKLFSAWPTSMSSRCITLASSHTLDSKLTALHLHARIIALVFFPILITQNESHHSDEVHILRDIALDRLKAVNPSYIAPNCSRIRHCLLQTRRLRPLCSCSGFQPGWRWKSAADIYLSLSK